VIIIVTFHSFIIIIGKFLLSSRGSYISRAASGNDSAGSAGSGSDVLRRNANKLSASGNDTYLNRGFKYFFFFFLLFETIFEKELLNLLLLENIY
jgi:hypothetical protein